MLGCNWPCLTAVKHTNKRTEPNYFHCLKTKWMALKCRKSVPDNYFDCVIHDSQSQNYARAIYTVHNMESFKAVCCENARRKELAHTVGFENSEVELSGCTTRM